MPDVRNVLLEEQTENLKWLILPKAHTCCLIPDIASLPEGCPLYWSGNLLALHVRDLCAKGSGERASPLCGSLASCGHIREPIFT